MSEFDILDNLNVHWKSSEKMDEVDDGSVQSVITSPPYWDLKDYNHEAQIGTADESYGQYHDRMQAVWSECYEKLRDDGTMWIVADTVMQNGDLRLLPYHIVEHAEEVGFRLQDLVTWYKPTAIAGMTDRNVVNKKEYIVFLSKNDEYKFRETNKEGKYEDPAIADEHRLGNLWRHPVKRGTVGQNVLHKAPFPCSLVRRLIKISTTPNDIVLDPFLGSGTTAEVALNLERQCVGYEINPEYESVIRDRIGQQTLTDF